MRLTRKVQNILSGKISRIFSGKIKTWIPLSLIHICTANLINQRDDKVKVVYHPDFISTSNPLFKMDYNQFVRGCHLGVFPSMYEPWGYTPLECLASGVPSITSNLAGFGDYVSRHILDNEKLGMYIIDRKHKDFDQTADELAEIMMRFVKMSRRERIALRYRSEEASLHFDWSNLGRYYDIASVSYTHLNNYICDQKFNTTLTMRNLVRTFTLLLFAVFTLSLIHI